MKNAFHKGLKLYTMHFYFFTLTVCMHKGYSSQLSVCPSVMNNILELQHFHA